jgi:glutaredoxin-like YruB-family protein
MDIKIYTTPTCGYCHQAKAFMDGLGVSYTEYDVSRDQAAAEEMVRLTGQMGVPVIIVDQEIIVGFNRPRLQELLAGGGRPERPHLGLKVADASRIARQAGEIPVFGALIGAVAPSSPGEKAGLGAGDIITEINLKSISGADDLEKTVTGLHSGSRLAITFLRGGQTLRAEALV